jgi:hypothetical protein
MNENENTNNPEEIVPTPEEVLQDLQKNSVPKEEAEAWKQKYFKLFRDVASGQRPEPEADHKAEFDAAVKAIAQKEAHTPLEHIDALLTVDDYETEQGHRSIFLPSQGDIDDSMVRSAEKVRALLEKARDQSEGSNEVAVAIIGNALRDVK